MDTRFGGGVLLGAALLWAAACSDSDVPDPGAACEPTSQGIATLFATSCTTSGCHNAVDAAANLDLESPGFEARLQEQPSATCNRTLIVSGDPGLSFLYEKLTSATPECGARMPMGAPLSDAELACLSDWISSLPPGCETCGGAGCADLQTDASNCGGCGTVCPSGASCQSGNCACGGSEQVCGGACVDTISDPSNCGACGKKCPPVQVCSLGACKAMCDAGLAKCGNSCVDTQSDPNNCGDCGVDCGATGSCVAGNCSCGAGIDTQTDPNNCGGCGNVCSPGQTCEAGACTCGTASVSFSMAVQPILSANCATIGCHRAPLPKEGMDLSAGNAYGNLVNVVAGQCNDGRMRVKPGDPASSYILDKILGVDLCFGSKMPKLGSVANADIEAISNWICAGALND